MGLRINTNVAAINAQRNLGTQQKRLEHSLSAMASGSRIVNAADDAAGLSISESIRGQTVGIKAARNNAFNAISLVQVAEGGLNEISNIMIRLRELGVQSASDNVSDTERAFLDNEAQQLLEEADRISKSTRFGNKTLLDGAGDEMEFHVGPFAGEENVIRYRFTADATGSALGYDGLDVASKDGARDTLGSIDEVLTQIGKMRADFGAVQSRLQTTTSNLDIQYENLSAAKSRIRDTDFAFESSEMASAQILQQASVGVLAQANQSGNSVMRLLG